MYVLPLRLLINLKINKIPEILVKVFWNFSDEHCALAISSIFVFFCFDQLLISAFIQFMVCLESGWFSLSNFALACTKMIYGQKH